jgi:hypothetical protein
MAHQDTTSNGLGSGAPGASSYRIFQNSDGTYFVTGVLEQTALPFARYFFVMKLDSSGNILWTNGYGDTSTYFDVNIGTSAYLGADGNLVLAGQSNAFLSTSLSEYTGWMLKVDGMTGSTIYWQQTYWGPTTYGAGFDDVISTQDGGSYAVGNVYVGSGAYGGPAFWTLKTDLNGGAGTSYVQGTSTVAQPLTLTAYPATFTRAADGAKIASASLSTKTVSVTPKKLQ